MSRRPAIRRHALTDPDDGVPGPLADIVGRIHAALARLATEDGARSDLHAVRNHVSEICALAEHDPRILRAIDRLVNAADRLAEASVGIWAAHQVALRPRLLAAARRAVRNLDVSLVGARPSKIALSVNRDW